MVACEQIQDIFLTRRSGPELLLQHHGDSSPVVTVTVAVVVAAAAAAVVAADLLVVAGPRLLDGVHETTLRARMTAVTVTATTTATAVEIATALAAPILGKSQVRLFKHEARVANSCPAATAIVMLRTTVMIVTAEKTEPTAMTEKVSANDGELPSRQWTRR